LDEFIQYLIAFVGINGFNPEAGKYLFLSYANPDITMAEFCRMILPHDQDAYSKVIGRHNKYQMSS